MRALVAAALLFALACGETGHHAHGVVREVRSEDAQVVISHEDIPGLMPAMTMNFGADAALLETLAAGQVIEFQVEFSGKDYRITAVEVVGHEDDAAGGARIGNAVAPGERAPDFALTNQDGAAVSLASLRGRLVLLDFIYASCPGPCPILTATHVALQRMLPDDLRARAHFVSITIDPARDSPAALRAYAAARGVDLEGWSFLTGSVEDVDAVLRAYGVGNVRKRDGTVDHLVITFLIDEEGGIVERYVGFDHDAEALLRDLGKTRS